MRSLAIEARAKVNLWLEVGPARADGFHDIDTVFQSVSLFDRLEFASRRRPGLDFEADVDFDCPPEDNLVVRAYEGYCSLLGSRPGMELHLRKGIPSQAGLGGGSADAAAVLDGMMRFHPLPPSRRGELEALAARLGSDVPFFLHGGVQRGRGRGELLEALSSKAELFFLLLKPVEGMATGRAYGLLDEGPPSTRPSEGIDRLIDALCRGQAGEVARGMHNDFQSVVSSVVPEVEAAQTALRDWGAMGSLMSGSGTAVFGIFPGASPCQKARSRANTQFPSWGTWILRSEARALVAIES